MAGTLYADKMVEIHHESIIFRRYYFPVGSKKIRFSDVQRIETLQPTVKNGKWRIHGTGDFRTWFPLDTKRPQRDIIFILVFHRRWWRTGFTVEDSDKVIQLFNEKGLLKRADAV